MHAAIKIKFKILYKASKTVISTLPVVMLPKCQLCPFLLLFSIKTLAVDVWFWFIILGNCLLTKKLESFNKPLVSIMISIILRKKCVLCSRIVDPVFGKQLLWLWNQLNWCCGWFGDYFVVVAVVLWKVLLIFSVTKLGFHKRDTFPWLHPSYIRFFPLVY